MPDALYQSVRFMVELHRLVRCGRDDLAEGKEIRGKLDVLWRELSPEQQKVMSDLSAALHEEGE